MCPATLRRTRPRPLCRRQLFGLGGRSRNLRSRSPIALHDQSGNAFHSHARGVANQLPNLLRRQLGLLGDGVIIVPATRIIRAPSGRSPATPVRGLLNAKKSRPVLRSSAPPRPAAVIAIVSTQTSCPDQRRRISRSALADIDNPAKHGVLLQYQSNDVVMIHPAPEIFRARAACSHP